jgi:hypothetical protein
MATDSLLNRINKMDFFAVLPAGFYSVIMIGFWFIEQSNPKNIMEAINPIAQALKDNPVYLVFLLFAAYLVGSIFRALKVKWAECICPPFHSSFPFSEELNRALIEIKTSGSKILIDSHLPDIKNGLTNNEFNYWKDVLCIKSERGFEYYETFETRTRFSAGMVWAGVVGIVSGSLMFFRGPNIAWQMLVISLVVYSAFGFHLLRVRRQESKALLFLYIALTQP